MKATQISTSSQCTVIRWNTRFYRKRSKRRKCFRKVENLCWNTLWTFFASWGQFRGANSWMALLRPGHSVKLCFKQTDVRERNSKPSTVPYPLYAAEWKKNNKFQLTRFLFGYGSYFRGPWSDNKEQRRDDKAKSYSAIHDSCKTTRKMLFRKYQGIYI